MAIEINVPSPEDPDAFKTLLRELKKLEFTSPGFGARIVFVSNSNYLTMQSTSIPHVDVQVLERLYPGSTSGFMMNFRFCKDGTVKMSIPGYRGYIELLATTRPWSSGVQEIRNVVNQFLAKEEVWIREQAERYQSIPDKEV